MATDRHHTTLSGRDGAPTRGCALRSLDLTGGYPDDPILARMIGFDLDANMERVSPAVLLPAGEPSG